MLLPSSAEGEGERVPFFIKSELCAKKKKTCKFRCMQVKEMSQGQNRLKGCIDSP